MERPLVLLVFNRDVRERYVTAEDLARLERFAAWEWLPAEGGRPFEPNPDPTATEQLAARIGEATAVVICHGAPKITAALMDQAPRLRFIGELEGDRFAYRIEVEAAWQRGIRVVDTTHGSSYPVAEWALGLMLIGLRNAGAHFRRLIAGEVVRLSRDDPGYLRGELTGKRVGLIGCGHIGRRLVGLLRPLQVTIWVYDPYLPKEVADALGVSLTSLEHVLADTEVVVCLAPLTPRTYRMIGARELALLRPGTVLVNVSRGAIIDPEALTARLEKGDIIACLDVFDPEPIPVESPIRRLPNVFLSPHIAGVTAACGPRFFRLMVDELERFVQGHETLYDLTPRTLANRRGLEPATITLGQFPTVG